MIETEKTFRLPCIKSNETTISLKGGFHSSLYVASGNTKEEKCYETFHTLTTFTLSLGPLNIVINVNRSDFNIFKQISPVAV